MPFAQLPVYRHLLERFLQQDDELQREDVLLAASELSKALLQQQMSIDDMLALHHQAQADLADAWSTPAGAPHHREAYRRLAAGGATPLMLALLLPHQLDEQLQAQRRWQAEHGKLAAMFRQTDDLVLVFDATGALEYLNPAFQRATGWGLGAARQQQAHIWPTPLGAAQTVQLSTEQVCADGQRFLASWSVSPVRDGDEQLLCHVCIGRDITALRRMEESMRENDKLRAVSTLAAGVAHDFNNLLGSILSLIHI